MGCFIKYGKFTATDKISGFLLQTGLCWSVGWLFYVNDDSGIYMESFIMVIMHPQIIKVFLIGPAYIFFHVNYKGKCLLKQLLQLVIREAYCFGSFVTSAWMISRWDFSGPSKCSLIGDNIKFYFSSINYYRIIIWQGKEICTLQILFIYPNCYHDGDANSSLWDATLMCEGYPSDVSSHWILSYCSTWISMALWGLARRH